MRKVIKSIIATALLCVCASGVLACGPDSNGDSKDSCSFTLPTRYGLLILDENRHRVYRTTLEDCKDVPEYSVAPQYTVTLEKDKQYYFCAGMLSQYCYSFYEGVGFHPDDYGDENDENPSTIINSADFEYDDEKIEIDNEGCYYCEFNFTGLQEGECDVKFVMTNTITSKDIDGIPNGMGSNVRIEEVTYNLHFIFE